MNTFLDETKKLHVPCNGLLSIEKDKESNLVGKVPIVLEEAKIDTKIVDFISEVRLSHVYINDTENPIDTVFVIPLYQEATVADIELYLDDPENGIKVEKLRTKTIEISNSAVLRESVIHLQERNARNSMIDIGKLNSGVRATIIVRHISENKKEGNNVVLSIPTTITSRDVLSEANVQPGIEIRGSPDKNISSAPLTIQFEIKMPYAIEHVCCPGYDAFRRDEYDEVTGDEHSWKGVLETSLKDLVTKLTLSIGVNEEEVAKKPVVYLEKYKMEDGNYGLASSLSWAPWHGIDKKKREIILLVDNSKSMKYQMKSIKEALVLFLHSLPIDCYFNVYSSNATSRIACYENSGHYTNDSMIEAISYLESINYDCETDIRKIAKKVLGQPYILSFHRQVFILTNECGINDSGVMAILKEIDCGCQVFLLEFVNNPPFPTLNRKVVQGVVTDFILQNEDLKRKILQMLHKALMDVVDNIMITWNGMNFGVNKELQNQNSQSSITNNRYEHHENTSNLLSVQIPQKLPALRSGESLLVYWDFEKFWETNNHQVDEIEISATSPYGHLSVKFELDASHVLESENLIKALAERRRVKELKERNFIHCSQRSVKLYEVENAIAHSEIGENSISSSFDLIGANESELNAGIASEISRTQIQRYPDKPIGILFD